jgi:hypothetical protein
MVQWPAVGSTGPNGQRLAKLLRNLENRRSPEGKAFATLCTSGCDPNWLLTVLLRLGNYPAGRSQLYTKSELTRVEKIISDLEAVAGAWERLKPDEPRGRVLFAAFIAWPSLSDWPNVSNNPCETAQPEHLPMLLRKIAEQLRESLNAFKKRNFVGMTASRRIPHLIEKIRDKTGAPHFREASILISAACGRQISAAHVKDMCKKR